VNAERRPSVVCGGRPEWWQAAEQGKNAMSDLVVLPGG
jgi:hypothetical protein